MLRAYPIDDLDHARNPPDRSSDGLDFARIMNPSREGDDPVRYSRPHVMLFRRPAPVLVDAARSADLLVVGTRGLGRAREAIQGSVNHACAHRSPVPVAVIPRPE
jgi:hypothetical protein